jgi:hypothetical protein
LFVVVIPVLPTDKLVAFVVPKFKAAAESIVNAPAAVDQVAAAAEVSVNAPELVDQVDAAAPVKVRAPSEVTLVVWNVSAAKAEVATKAKANTKTEIISNFCLFID